MHPSMCLTKMFRATIFKGWIPNDIFFKKPTYNLIILANTIPKS